MNTYIEFTTWTNKSNDDVYKVFNNGFRQFHHVVDNFSRFDPKSELSRLNHSGGIEISVSSELFNLIKFALDIAKKTDGIFDPTIIDFLQTYGYGANYNFNKLNKKELIQKEVQQLLKSRSSYKDIKLDPESRIIQLSDSQRIDLGSIGKGYAIDLAYKELKPLKNFVINAGGDIRSSGLDQTKQPWLIDVKKPKGKSLGNIQLKNKALCCSGSWARKVKFFHHLINPKTGTPQNDLKATFVIADKAIDADAWATALYALGNKAEEYIKKYSLTALIVLKNNKVINNNFPTIGRSAAG